MTTPRTIGFPRMMKEPGEKRVFLPEFIQHLANLGAEVVIEEGYGSRSGFTFDDYQLSNPAVHMGTREQAFNQDVVLVLRSPTPADMRKIKPGTILMSMLHYPTRPRRFDLLCQLGICAISLDSIVDDINMRLVENTKSVAWNGLEVAFDHLETVWTDLKRPDGRPIQVLILGSGLVGRYAVDATTHLGNIERNFDHIRMGGPGATAIAVGRNLTNHPDEMRRLFEQADILVDATQRRDTSKPVVPNEWMAWLPQHAVMVDLAVDPYLLNCDPKVVRGLEGIPQGNLDQYKFAPDDPKWDLTVPESIPSANRRTAVTCYSWPGIHPEACMRHYGQQLKPLMEALFNTGYGGLSLQGGFFERALYRATLDAWRPLRPATPLESSEDEEM